MSSDLLAALLIVFIGGAGTAAAEPAIFPAPSQLLLNGNINSRAYSPPQIFQQIVESAGLPHSGGEVLLAGRQGVGEAPRRGGEPDAD
jgi:hypothetical protein